MSLKVNRDLRHDRAVRDIAAARFDFPTKEFPNFRAFVNEPEPTMGVKGLEGEAYYPDIVVIDTGNVVRILAEVETKETVTEEEARREWLPYSQLCDGFYLYVPAGWSNEAKRICKQLGVKLTGVRTWRYIQGAAQLDLADIY